MYGTIFGSTYVRTNMPATETVAKLHLAAEKRQFVHFGPPLCNTAISGVAGHGPKLPPQMLEHHQRVF
jgi:hypothetical protein